MEIVESKFGNHARDVVQNLFLLGHTKVSDLVEAYESQQELHAKENGIGHTNGINGHDEAHNIAAGQLHMILAQLLQAGLIEPVIESMFRSPTDIYNKVEREILQERFGGSTKGFKQKDELKANIQARLHDLRSEGREWRLQGKKRSSHGDQVNGANGSSKKRRIPSDSGAVNGDHSCEDDGMRLDVGSQAERSRKKVRANDNEASSGNSHQL